MPDPLRVMTFNIRGFYRDDGPNLWEHRREMNVALIRRYQPDLIGLQEVQTGNLKTYHRELHDYWSMAWPEYNNAPPHEWPAIFWRPDVLQPLDSGGFWLSETPECFSGSWDTDCIRSAAWVRFRDVRSGQTLVHVNTHLDHVSERARIEGSRVIIRRMADLQRDGDTAIVTGDFNAPPASPVHRLWLDNGFADTFLAAGGDDDDPTAYTGHAYRGEARGKHGGGRRIDWILVRPANGQRLGVQSCDVIRDAAPPVYPSDHYPVLSCITTAGG
jgi:endonuclease/exonuclease/phosphatase family metal-dependent hydrolase